MDRRPCSENDLVGEHGARVTPLFARGQTATYPMTRDHLSDVEITSESEFEAVLIAAVEKAIIAGVDVRGAWEFETRGSTHNGELEIVERARGSDEEVDEDTDEE